MNLDEMLAASGISGGAAAVNGNTKSGFVTFVGRPNVGKSTLMNRLIGQKIAITSNKPQTTRNKIQTVFTDERGQIVFVDTPGIHKAKNKLGEYMVGAAERLRKKKFCRLLTAIKMKWILWKLFRFPQETVTIPMI